MTPIQRLFAIAALLGAAGMWLLLPRGTGHGKVTGAVLALFAVGIWGWDLPGLTDFAGGTIFYVLAGTTLVAAAATISLANPVYCAIWFGVSLVGTSGLFFYQGSQFLAVATVVIYAGAILVTFLFVLMLAHPGGRAYYDRVSWEALVSAATGAVMAGVLLMALYGTLPGQFAMASGLRAKPAAEMQEPEGVLAADHVGSLGMQLFSRYLPAVEVAGVLLLVALVGAASIVAPVKAALAAPPMEK